MLGPKAGDKAFTLPLKVLFDYSMNHVGELSVATHNDLTASISRYDEVTVGTCSDVFVQSLRYESNGSIGHGHIYNTKYAIATVTKRVQLQGYSVLTLKSSSGILNFISECSLKESAEAEINIGKTVRLKNSYGSENLVVMKAFTADITSFHGVPDTNWRGT